MIWNSKRHSESGTAKSSTVTPPTDIRNRLIFLFIFVAIFFIMFILNSYTPLLSDDFVYAFSFRDTSRIEKIADIFPSLAAHRVYTNGRVFSHFFVQLFSMAPKTLFNVINAGITVGIFVIIFLFIKSDDKKINIVCLLSAIFLIWCFTPDFGQVFLWFSGSCNYSWAIFFTLLYLYPYYSHITSWDIFSSKRNIVLNILFMLLSVIAGGYSESISFAAIFTAICFTLYRFYLTRKVDLLLLSGIVLSCGGYVFLMSAPVETGDLGVFSYSAIQYNFIYNLSSIAGCQIALYCIFAFIFVLSLMSNVNRISLVVSVILMLGGAGTVAAFSFAKYCPPRALITVTVYTVLSILMLLRELWSKYDKRIICACVAALGLFFFGEAAKGVNDIIVNNSIAEKHEEIIIAAKESADRTVILPKYIPLTKYSAMWNGEKISAYHGYWVNVAMANYYDLDYIIAEEAGQ